MNKDVKNFMEIIVARNPHETEFHQAVCEVAESLIPYVDEYDIYAGKKILLRISEPERTIIFRVPWVDDKGNIHVNRGYRVQMNSAIGPYKGGLRFHPSVNLSILKFLAFEQCFKNSLTTLPLGGAKGGSDFDPKDKSDLEIMRFCQSFMSELFRHIGPKIDVPAGDIGVGSREVGYLFGQYKKLKIEFSGVITGKGLSYGGSLIRPEATGYGAAYFANYMLARKDKSIEGKKVLVSGSGNVAQYAAEKIIQLGGKVLTMSDSAGFIYDADGINQEKLHWIMELKNKKRGRISEYTQQYKNATFHENKKPWQVAAEIAFPCATQNELNEEDAKTLTKNGLICVSEGANMPCTAEAYKHFQAHGVLYAPGKASNAGGVAVSGLEMSQNSQNMKWSRETVDERLKEIMGDIHETCVQFGTKDGKTDYMIGANRGGFVKLADAMLAHGVV